MLKKHLCVIRRLSCGKKFTIQQNGAPCHTASSVTSYLNKNVPDCIRKENWPPNFCDLSLHGYANWNIMKKILHKNFKWYEDIESLSGAMSYAWDRLMKKFINNYNTIININTYNLTTPTRDSTYISIVIDLLFINRKLNMIKQL